MKDAAHEVKESSKGVRDSLKKGYPKGSQRSGGKSPSPGDVSSQIVEGPTMAMQDSQTVATDESSSLISSDKVEGTAVYDRRGEKLGSIHSVMIDKISGKVAYAVMSFGGFLGMGDSYHPLPWHVLTYDTGQGGYVVDLDRNKLEGAPTYATSETPNWSDRRWGQQVHDYYGTRPYWE